MKKEVKENLSISIPEMDIQKVVFKIKGITPLIINCFSEKAIGMMLDKQMKKATKGKEAKNPEEQYNGATYFFKDGKRSGIPARSFKASMIRAAKQVGMVMVDTKGMFFVLPEEDDLIEIKGNRRMRQDMVRLSTGVSDIRFRPEYTEWTVNLNIEYNATTISLGQLANLISVAGFSCGVGEWRPNAPKSCSGDFGRFELIK